MSNTDDEFLEDVLNEYARNLHEYSNGVPGHHNDYREQTDQAKQAIQDLITKARIDEVESMAVLAVDIEELLPLLAERLEQLKEQTNE